MFVNSGVTYTERLRWKAVLGMATNGIRQLGGRLERMLPYDSTWITDLGRLMNCGVVTDAGAAAPRNTEQGYFRLKMGEGPTGLCGIASAASYPVKTSPNKKVPEVGGRSSGGG